MDHHVHLHWRPCWSALGQLPLNLIMITPEILAVQSEKGQGTVGHWGLRDASLGCGAVLTAGRAACFGECGVELGLSWVSHLWFPHQQTEGDWAGQILGGTLLIYPYCLPALYYFCLFCMSLSMGSFVLFWVLHVSFLFWALRRFVLIPHFASWSAFPLFCLLAGRD